MNIYLFIQNIINKYIKIIYIIYNINNKITKIILSIIVIIFLIIIFNIYFLKHKISFFHDIILYKSLLYYYTNCNAYCEKIQQNHQIIINEYAKIQLFNKTNNIKNKCILINNNFLITTTEVIFINNIFDNSINDKIRKVYKQRLQEFFQLRKEKLNNIKTLNKKYFKLIKNINFIVMIYHRITIIIQLINFIIGIIICLINIITSILNITYNELFINLIDKSSLNFYLGVFFIDLLIKNNLQDNNIKTKDISIFYQKINNIALTIEQKDSIYNHYQKITTESITQGIIIIILFLCIYKLKNYKKKYLLCSLLSLILNFIIIIKEIFHNN
jgi:hypothetical protein